MTLIPSKAMVRRLRWHLVLKVATTLVMIISSASSLLESMWKCVWCSKRTTGGFLLTHVSSPRPPSPPSSRTDQETGQAGRGKRGDESYVPSYKTVNVSISSPCVEILFLHMYKKETHRKGRFKLSP